MRIIRPEQLSALKRVPLINFKQELLAHLQEFAPELYALRGDEVFLQVIDDGIDRAMAYGFSTEGPVRFFVESMLSYGSEFDTDPQISGLVELFTNPDELDQMSHADQLYELIERYQAETKGSNNEYAIEALQQLKRSTTGLKTLTMENLENELLAMMRQIYPEKYGFVGENTLRLLINQARLDAGVFGISIPAGICLLSILMFAMGHGVTRDPLYPWVHNTLANSLGKKPAERVDRLRGKSEIYLAATLDNLASGS